MFEGRRQVPLIVPQSRRGPKSGFAVTRWGRFAQRDTRRSPIRRTSYDVTNALRHANPARQYQAGSQQGENRDGGCRPGHQQD